jgi:soluble lytic murein transglycosylase-like protein
VKGVRILSIVGIVLALGAAEARAEIVYFSTGRTLSIKDHRADDDKLVLSLRAGGEIVCDPALIDRIVPDEVPYPEPEAEKPAAVVAAETPQASLAPVKYGDIIEKVSAEQDVPVKLVRAVIQVESAYHERARSPKGAMGLMQLMPATAKQYAVADPYDPASNIEAGVKHLKSLLQRLPVALALAAYNAGEVAVIKYRGVPPYRETRAYVKRIMKRLDRSTARL